MRSRVEVLLRSASVLNEGLSLGSADGGVSDRLWVCSDLGALCQLKSVLDINSRLGLGAFNFDVTEKDLDGSEITIGLKHVDAFGRRSECVPCSCG